MSIGNTRRSTEVLSLIPNDVVASTKTGSAVDLQDYEGDLDCILDAEAGGGSVTYAVKFTESDTSGGSYTDVTDGAFTTTDANTAKVEKISINSDELKRYVKVVVTVAGGTGTGAVSVVAVGIKKHG